MAIIDFIKSHYILMILLLAATISNFVWLFLNRKDLKMNLTWLILFPIFHTIIGLIFVVLFAFMEGGFKADSLGNISIYGGMFFMPIVYLLYALIRKIKFSRTFDIFTISLITTLFFARINCLVSGCCEGILIGETNFRVPTREIELLFYLLFVIFSVSNILKEKTNGYIYPMYMISYGVLRLILEFFRESDSNGALHIGHIWSIVAIVIGIMFIIYLKFFRGIFYVKNKEKKDIK